MAFGPSLRSRSTILIAVFTLLLSACAGDGQASPSPTARAERTPPGPPTRSPQVEAWAAAVCRAVDDFGRAYLATNDGANPSALTLQERKARAERVFPAQIEAAATAARALAAVTPPSSTAHVHSVLERGYEELGRLLTEQREVVAQAQTAAEVEASNPPVRAVLDDVLQYGPLLASEGYCAGGAGRRRGDT